MSYNAATLKKRDKVLAAAKKEKLWDGNGKPSEHDVDVWRRKLLALGEEAVEIVENDLKTALKVIFCLFPSKLFIFCEKDVQKQFPPSAPVEPKKV